MGIFLDLYKLKIKVLLGAIRSSKASIILVAFYLIGTIPGSLGGSITIIQAIKQGIDLTAYLDVLSAILSAFLAMVLLATLKGFVAFEYEQNLIFTSPMTPRLFLFASLLADITALSFFFFPLFLFFIVIAVMLQLTFVSSFLLFIALILFAFFLFFIKASFSILKSTRPSSQIRTITLGLIFALLLPALSLIGPFPIKYSMLSYPSTLLAEVILTILSYEILSTQVVLHFVFLCLYFLVSLVFFIRCSKENLFQFTRPVPLVSPFDTSMQMQTVKMGKNIQFFSRFSLQFTLGLDSGSLLRFLMKKELIRMVRDGSLFSVFLFYIIVSVMNVVSGRGEAPFPMWLLILATYSFIIPFMLISNWRIGELDTLWIPLTSGMDFKFLANSLLYDFTLITFIVPAGTIAILTFISQIDPLMPFVLVTSISLIGCSSNLYLMMHFLSKQRRATPSMMINWLSMLFSGLLISPTFAYIGLGSLFSFSFEINLLISFCLLAYSIIIFWLLSKRIGKKALQIEI